ncbi:MAG: deoxyribonuclease IV [Acidobacteriota bacterium]
MPPQHPDSPLVGAHVSVAGGLPKAFPRAAALGCTAIQVFVKNGNQWRGPELTQETVDAFRAARTSSSVRSVVAHASYLINLASRETATFTKSLDALTDELERCHRLGIDGLVLHPGAHRGSGIEVGVERVAESLDNVFSRSGRLDTTLLLENTAGQGTYLGSTLEELAGIRSRCAHPEQIGFCLDTCHAFAAGAPIQSESGLGDWLQHVEAILGVEHVRCFHFNDSLGDCGSRRDRHANLGEGRIGMRAFANLMRAPQLKSIPKVLETPTGEASSLHRADLAKLRAAARRKVQSKPLRVRPRRRQSP